MGQNLDEGRSHRPPGPGRAELVGLVHEAHRIRWQKVNPGTLIAPLDDSFAEAVADGIVAAGWRRYDFGGRLAALERVADPLTWLLLVDILGLILDVESPAEMRRMMRKDGI